MGSADSANAGSLLCTGAVLLTGSHLPLALHKKRHHVVLLRHVKKVHNP